MTLRIAFVASGVTSFPMPSPAITAMRAAGPPSRNGLTATEDFLLPILRNSSLPELGSVAQRLWSLRASTSFRTVNFSIKSTRGVKPMPGALGTRIVPCFETVTSGSMMSALQ
jgi:hypothetical protein